LWQAFILVCVSGTRCRRKPSLFCLESVFPPLDLCATPGVGCRVRLLIWLHADRFSLGFSSPLAAFTCPRTGIRPDDFESSHPVFLAVVSAWTPGCRLPFFFSRWISSLRAATSSFVTILVPALAWILTPVQTSFHRCVLLPSAGSDLGFLLFARAISQLRAG
jgi:hypothetical protein